MIHPADEQYLTQMLSGDKERSPELLQEYDIRQRMFHRCGASGPLGVAALVDMCRHLGLSPPAVKKSVEPIVWNQLPQDGSVEILALRDGRWVPGRFLGFVQYGSLAIRLDGDRSIREYYPVNVTLPDRVTPVVAEAATAVESEPDPPVDSRSVFEMFSEAAGGASELKAGQRVWVEYDGDILDGECLGMEGDQVNVQIDGEKAPRMFRRAAVMSVA